MNRLSPSDTGVVKAVLGPTNTGKTHLAVERMVAHASGMIGFPLRLLAREVYDRVVALKGPAQVALVTGEERIIPPHARYLLCTAEAMPMPWPTDWPPSARAPADTPVGRSLSFVAIDEAQLGADPERGHVFTDRILRARGRDETMILGSATLGPVVRDLVPEAEIVARPRFSTLSYAGARKLSRLPKRSVIVAFSAEEVYAIAEALRRFAGGAAVVMGALSPRTRNAQVALFQSGEVDYLVATDAVGMGLNLDTTHVAFAGFSKFDGRRQRRLTVPEMAQIAGRAGRHQSDGTFGSLGQDADAFTAEEVEAIEDHRFDPLPFVYWRNADLDLSGVAPLIASLEVAPDHPRLRPAPQAVDLAVLHRIADVDDVRHRAVGPAMVARLWDLCGLPDFQKLGAEHHSRTVLRLWHDRSRGDGHIDPEWFLSQMRKLDRVDGDIDTLAGRIAAVRTLAYIAHRADWLADAPTFAAETRALEGRLSDALHDALTARFVNRRTTVLLRDLKSARGAVPVTIATDGAVQVDGEIIGHLDGFRFRVDPSARARDHRMLLAAAERHLQNERSARVQALAEAPDSTIHLDATPAAAPAILWGDTRVATLERGRALLEPRIVPDAAVRALDAADAAKIEARLGAWLDAMLTKHVAPLRAAQTAAEDAETPGPVRALLAQFVDAGGLAARTELGTTLGAIGKDDRPALRKLGITIGSLDLYQPLLLKPGAAQWRAVLLALWHGRAVAPLPAAGHVLIRPEGDAAHDGARIAGFRPVGTAWLRLDMIERLAREAHLARASSTATPVSAAAAPVDNTAGLPTDNDPDTATDAAVVAEATIEAAPDIPVTTPDEHPAVAPDAEGSAPPESDGNPASETPEPTAQAPETQPPESEAPARELPPGAFVVDPALATSLGLDTAAHAELLSRLGFRPVEDGAVDPAVPPAWRWGGLRREGGRNGGRGAGHGGPRRGAGDDADRGPARRRGKKPDRNQPRADRAHAPKHGPRPAAKREPNPHSPFAALGALLQGADKSDKDA